MDNERYNADLIWKSLVSRYDRGLDIHWDEEIGRLRRSLIDQKYWTEKKFIFLKIAKYFGNSKIRILDYGCGSGQLACYLQLLGYPEVCGVDVFSQTKNNHVLKLMGLQGSLFQYDRKSLPFKDESFDLVTSEQVLEHVLDIDSYYRETARVVKKGGMAYLSFPHKLIPFDTHSRTWFIHMFPRLVRKVLYRMWGRDPAYFEALLNLKTVGHHKRVAAKYFSVVLNETGERFVSFDGIDLQRYEGNISIRKAADYLVKTKPGKAFILPALSKVSNVDFCMFK